MTSRGLKPILLLACLAACETDPPRKSVDAGPIDGNSGGLSDTSAGITQRPDLDPGLAPIGAPCNAFISCVPSATCLLGTCSTWGAVNRLRIDFSDAHLDRPLTDVPVLIRFDATSPVFASNHAKGAALRFTDQNLRVLSHEIEAWDSELPAAAVWVRLPSLTVGQPHADLFVFHGGGDVPDTSSGKDVFADYDQVFHFSDPVRTSTGTVFPGVLPASAPLRSGYPPSPETALWVASTGIAGPALRLSGAVYPYSLAAPSAASTESTFTLWFRSNTSDGGALASYVFTDRDGIEKPLCLLWLDDKGHLKLGVLDGSRYLTLPVLASLDEGQWHQIHVIFAGAKVGLSVDGESMAEGTLSQVFARPTGTFFIGTAGNAAFPSSPGDPLPIRPFDGWVDEIRITPVALSPAFIGLSHAREKPAATPPIWLPTEL